MVVYSHQMADKCLQSREVKRSQRYTSLALLRKISCVFELSICRSLLKSKRGEAKTQLIPDQGTTGPKTPLG